MKKLLLSLFSMTNAVFFSAEVSGGGAVADKYAEARAEMVESQVKTRGVLNAKVLKAMNEVPRHEFIPARFLSGSSKSAYGDYPVPIGEGQTISQPYIVALMTELLDIKTSDKVLEIGTGSGYQAAVLSKLAKEVYTVEIVENLALWAKEKLADYKNVSAKHGDGYLGWPEHAPFNKIIVTCAPDNIPKPLLEQLAPGGKMVIPVGEFPRQDLKVVEKDKAGLILERDIIPVLFVPMTRDK
ncbi:MAG TPA: protein-L-isoaspartate O-methyltransferase [Elusimicrobia bacterium]|nr:MAG: protein-L-isoaspartate O-methyltransferase [Elusimicrobia bacterium RIFOXYA12_FULL_49_49]OGS07799.1 MAG: protein-L-isoaspartate O-methyltransferase [Elusimicrobia bacterium RIFOXYA1_FULL_47_7]OGS09278.1 MAG: protein-L-isoaspartate O-methyltransferase [Elusimicrobia bacterium RIFOXYB1_FULL_48_9]OGS15217.1 MAG: protein-L-isoaspartate O-methyltransferase [Elusimicrobia bacterium RIFOXYA2_FULL_47_53]OGS25928.1 MAG: protein-L-isoaspartate O-methyltransferase [Elusimicrobia bacterium RIFOXYB1